MHRIVEPVANEFEPQLIIVAAGFDSCIGDPLSQNKVTPQWFKRATRMLQVIDRIYCFSKITSIINYLIFLLFYCIKEYS